MAKKVLNSQFCSYFHSVNDSMVLKFVNIFKVVAYGSRRHMYNEESRSSGTRVVGLDGRQEVNRTPF